MQAVDVLWGRRAAAANDGKGACVVQIALIGRNKQRWKLTACVSIALCIAKSRNDTLHRTTSIIFSTAPDFILNSMCCATQQNQCKIQGSDSASMVTIELESTLWPRLAAHC